MTLKDVMTTIQNLYIEKESAEKDLHEALGGLDVEQAELNRRIVEAGGVHLDNIRMLNKKIGTTAEIAKDMIRELAGDKKQLLVFDRVHITLSKTTSLHTVDTDALADSVPDVRTLLDTLGPVDTTKPLNQLLADWLLNRIENKILSDSLADLVETTPASTPRVSIAYKEKTDD